jgi:hypothetical protein
MANTIPILKRKIRSEYLFLIKDNTVIRAESTFKKMMPDMELAP